jgi:4-hydroxybutyrate CoA-transferase
MRTFERGSLADVVARLRPGMKILIPPACGEPRSLVAEICAQADRLAPLTLMGGLHLGDYPFCRPELAGRITFVTWHMSPDLHEASRRGQVNFVPVRYFDVVRVFNRGGVWEPDCVVVHATPPDHRGFLSLGVSVSVTLPAARRAPLVIAQVNPRMPRTHGQASLHRSEIDAWAEVEEDLVSYSRPSAGDTERAIGRRVAELVSDGSTVQVGIGAIPQAILECLDGKRDLSLYSLLVDSAVPLCEQGVVTSAERPIQKGRMDIGEIMGTRRVFEFAHDNPAINMQPSDVLHDPNVVARLGRFVSINSALEVDLTGQVTAESIGGRQVAGIGGQFDFVLGASQAAEGVSIIALPSTGRGGSVSRIVPRLSPGSAVTTPRYLVDWVVTENGAARLRGLGERERAAALIALAHPRFVEDLERGCASSS